MQETHDRKNKYNVIDGINYKDSENTRLYTELHILSEEKLF